MRVTKKISLAILLSLSLMGWAQDPNAQANFGFGLGLGTEVIDGKTWQNLSFVPDLAFGDFGIGFDLRINFQFYDGPGSPFGFYPRVEDWKANSADFVDWAQLYLSKIAYIRWGLKGKPLYIKLGMIQDGTLGNGFLMANYNNTILRPEKKITGLAFDLDGSLFGFPLVGFETFSGNLISPDVLGARLYLRPLVWSGLPILDAAQLGGTFVTDLDPWRYSQSPNPGNVESVKAFGVDVRIPLVNLENAFSLALFGDATWLTTKDKLRTGQMVGLGGSLISLITYGAQIRFLGQDFIPVYFDRGYDIKRDQNFLLLNGAGNIASYTGWLASLGFNLLEEKLVFYSSLEGPLGAPSAGSSNLSALYPKLRSLLRFNAPELVPVSLEAYYDKDNINSLQSLFSGEDALVGAKLGYKTGPAIIYLVYNARYLPTTSTWEVTSKLETVVKF